MYWTFSPAVPRENFPKLYKVAQSAWREFKNPGEPYTIDNDATGRYEDAVLTPKGQREFLSRLHAC